MANLSKASFFDCGKNPPRKSQSFVVDGERRIEHIPNGMVERWVKTSGSVVFQQLVQPGQLMTDAAVDAKRGEIRRRRPHDHESYASDFEWKWIEWHRCPLHTGTLSASSFPDDLRRPCPDNFKPKDRLSPCPHVAKVVALRLEEHDRRQKLLHAGALAKEQAAAAIEQRKLDQQQELNAALLELAKAGMAAKGKGRE
jgi:hypothetical protein